MIRFTLVLLALLTATPPTFSGEIHLDLGDILIGGDGCGAVPVGTGIRPQSGQLAQAGVFLAGGNHPAGFHKTDGSSGSVNRPFVEGVFTIDGPTHVTAKASGGPFGGVLTPFPFPDTTGDLWDAVRGGIALVDWGSTVIPIGAGDQPGVDRRGIGICPNAGVTFDLEAIRAAHPGSSTVRFEAVGGLNTDVGINGVLDAWAIVDGVQMDFQTYGIGQHSVINVPLSNTDKSLTLAFTESNGTIGWDHGIFADATLVLDGIVDCNDNHVLDSCDVLDPMNDCDANLVPDDCQWKYTAYGQGCSTTAFIPELDIGGCAASGGSLVIQVQNAVGGASALLLVGIGDQITPIPGPSGCDLNVSGVLPLVVPFALGGSAAIPGSGSATLNIPIGPPIVATFAVQTFVLEPSVPHGYSNSNAVHVELK